MNEPSLNADERAIMGAIRRSFAPYRLAAAIPTPHRPMSRLVAAVVPIGVGMLVGAVIVIRSVVSPDSAFATWTATPSTPNPALVEAVRDGCQSPPGPDWTAADHAYFADMATLPLVVVDQRGRGAVALFAERRAEGQASMMCLSVADEDGQVMAGGGGSSTGARETPAIGPLRLFTANRNRSEWGTITAYAGSIEPGVTQVIVERNTGSGVIASLSNGYFVAWWPGDAYATRIIAYGPGRSVLAEIGNNGWDFVDDDPDPSPGFVTPSPSDSIGE